MSSGVRGRFGISTYWRDVIWQASGNGLAQIIGVLGIPLLTRLYTPHDFAVQSLFVQVAMFAAGIMTWRYEYFVQLPKSNADANTLLHLVFCLGLAAFLILTPLTWIFREILARFLGEPDVAVWLVFAPGTALLICCALALQHCVQRQRNYRASGLSELAGKSGYVGSGILGCWLGNGPGGLIAATAVAALGKIAWLKRGRDIAAIPSDSKPETTYRFDIKAARRLAYAYGRLASSLVFSHLMTTCTAAVPIVFITHMYGAEVLGQFALVSSTIFLPAGLVGAAIGQVYYQRAAEHWANGGSFSQLWKSTAKRLVGIGLLAYIGIALVAPFAYPLVFGRAWADAGYYASLMAVSAFFSFVSSPLDRTCLIVGAWWYPAIWHFLRALTTVLIAFLAWFYNWQFNHFLVMLVMQICFTYLVDFLAEWRFSCRIQYAKQDVRI